MTVEKRRMEDNEIIATVANQLIEGLVRGAIFRRKQRHIKRNLFTLQAVAKSGVVLKKFHEGKQQQKQQREVKLVAERLQTPVVRPTTPVLNACHMVLHHESAESSRGTLGLNLSKVISLSGVCLPVSSKTRRSWQLELSPESMSAATLILKMKVDSHKLASKAMGWGFKLLDDGVMGLNDRGIKLLLDQPEVKEILKVFHAQRDVQSLSGDEARLLRMAADVERPEMSAAHHCSYRVWSF